MKTPRRLVFLLSILCSVKTLFAQGAPSVSGISPSLGPVGQWVYVFGSNFVGGNTKASVGGVSNITCNVYSPDQLGFTVPVGATGSTPIVITTPSGSVTSSTLYTVGVPSGAPSVSGISPSLGPVGQWVYVSGSNFVGGSTKVAMGGVSNISCNVYSPSQLGFTVPAGAIGTTPIVVTTPSGSAASSTSYTVGVPTGAPSISGISPVFGPVGQWVYVSGSNFVGGSTKASVGGISNISCNVYGPEQLGFTVPEGATGSTPIVITTPVGSATSGQSFTVGSVSEVSSSSVNEASPYAIFSIKGTAGRNVAFSLESGTATGGGVDYGSAVEATNLQYSMDGGATWLSYSTAFALPAGGWVLVRTPVVNDNLYDNNETFFLRATSTGGAVLSGTCTIKDDGTGDIYKADGTKDAVAGKNDDRPWPVVTSPASSSAMVGTAFTYQITASNGPSSFTATGLPAGLSINVATGVITGIPTAAGSATVMLTATNAVGSSAPVPLALTVTAPTSPFITVQPQSQTASAPGGNIGFSLMADGVPVPALQWYFNGAPITGATTATLALNNVQATAAGNYWAVATNSAGSVKSSVATFSLTQPGNSATQSVLGFGYASGQSLTLTNTLTYSGTASALSWTVLLPPGWSFASSAGSAGDQGPGVGTTDVLEWAWTNVPASPVTFTYTVNVPTSTVGAQELVALAGVRNGTSLQFLAQPDPVVVAHVTTHSADTNGDYRLSLLELTRVIELYNTRNGSNRTGCYSVATLATEDGFASDAVRAASGAVTLARYHNADSNRDGKIGLLELTRVIELYNFRSGTNRTGQYRAQVNTEDGFAPGP